MARDKALGPPALNLSVYTASQFQVLLRQRKVTSPSTSRHTPIQQIPIVTVRKCLRLSSLNSRLRRAQTFQNGEFQGMRSFFRVEYRFD